MIHCLAPHCRAFNEARSRWFGASQHEKNLACVLTCRDTLDCCYNGHVLQCDAHKNKHSHISACQHSTKVSTWPIYSQTFTHRHKQTNSHKCREEKSIGLIHWASLMRNPSQRSKEITQAHTRPHVNKPIPQDKLVKLFRIQSHNFTYVGHMFKNAAVLTRCVFTFESRRSPSWNNICSLNQANYASAHLLWMSHVKGTDRMCVCFWIPRIYQGIWIYQYLPVE